MRQFRIVPLSAGLAVALGFANPAAAIDLSTYRPFQMTVHCSASNSVNCTLLFSLPSGAGKVVIEDVSFNCGNQHPALAGLSTSLSAVSAFRYLEIPLLSASGGQVVRFYGDPGSQAEVFATFAVPGNYQCYFTIAGEVPPLS